MTRWLQHSFNNHCNFGLHKFHLSPKTHVLHRPHLPDPWNLVCAITLWQHLWDEPLCITKMAWSNHNSQWGVGYLGVADLPTPHQPKGEGGAGLGGPSAEVDSHSTLRLRHVLAVEFQIHRPWSRVIWAILWWDVSGVESKAAQTQNCSPDWADWGRWDIDDVRCETYGDLHGMSANQNRGCGHEPWEMLRYGHASQ